MTTEAWSPKIQITPLSAVVRNVYPTQCYNLGLQLLEMDRASEAERFVGRALGLLKLGSSTAFADRWGGVMYQVLHDKRTPLLLEHFSSCNTSS